MTPTTTITPGVLLAERYRLTRRIATGGMGEVWAAADTRLARDVAVKILRAELTSDPEFVDRFRSEARMTAALSDPGIAAVHDYGEVAMTPGAPSDTAYLVMEMVIGEPLSTLLARVGRLPAHQVIDILHQTGQALQAAHSRGLVHRDIKPSNLLLTPAGQVKITDFGVAKAVGQARITRGGLVMGTAQYFAPEQAAGRAAVPASDVYALGIVAFECLAGFRPFDGPDPVAIATAQVHAAPPPLPPDVPPMVSGLVMRMLAKDPAQRPGTGGALAAACAALPNPLPSPPPNPLPNPVLRPPQVPPQQGPPAPAIPQQVPQPPATPQPERRHRWAWFVLIVAVVIGVSAIVTVVIIRSGWESGANTCDNRTSRTTLCSVSSAPDTARAADEAPEVGERVVRR